MFLLQDGLLMLKIRELVAHVLLLQLMGFMKPPWQKLEQSLVAWICLNSIWLTVVTMEGHTRKLNYLLMK